MIPAFMKEALRRIAAPAIRNAGTFGGNIGNGSAKADTVLIEYVCDARLRLVSARASASFPSRNFIKAARPLIWRRMSSSRRSFCQKRDRTTTITRKWAAGTPWPSPGCPSPEH